MPWHMREKQANDIIYHNIQVLKSILHAFTFKSFNSIYYTFICIAEELTEKTLENHFGFLFTNQTNDCCS